MFMLRILSDWPPWLVLLWLLRVSVWPHVNPRPLLIPFHAGCWVFSRQVDFLLFCTFLLLLSEWSFSPCFSAATPLTRALLLLGYLPFERQQRLQVPCFPRHPQWLNPLQPLQPCCLYRPAYYPWPVFLRWFELSSGGLDAMRHSRPPMTSLEHSQSRYQALYTSLLDSFWPMFPWPLYQHTITSSELVPYCTQCLFTFFSSN